jgi:hypothetical protein
MKNRIVRELAELPKVIVLAAPIAQNLDFVGEKSYLSPYNAQYYRYAD